MYYFNIKVINFYIFFKFKALLAQWIELQPSKLWAVGSNPTGRVFIKNKYKIHTKSRRIN